MGRELIKNARADINVAAVWEANGMLSNSSSSYTMAASSRRDSAEAFDEVAKQINGRLPKAATLLRQLARDQRGLAREDEALARDVQITSGLGTTHYARD